MQSLDYDRQSTLIGSDRLTVPIHIIGVGSVGYQFARLLVAAQPTSVTLWDEDIVDDSNQATQTYLADDIGVRKVFAAKTQLDRINGKVDILTMPTAWTPASDKQIRPNSVVVCCVDSIETRAHLHRRQRNRCALWLDVRTLGETVFCYAATTPAQHRLYQKTLFSPDEAYSEDTECAPPGAAYAACSAACLLMYQFARWSRHAEVFPALGGLLCDLTIREPN